MSKFIAAIIAPALIVLAGCATAQFDTKSPVAAGRSIAGSQIYIYSFLDLRSADLGPSMVSQVNDQLRASLHERGIASEILTYTDTSTKNAVGDVYIPVDDIVAGNLAAEAALGADFRLIIMPTSMYIYGATQDYHVDWSLVDVRTGETIWTTNLSGGRTVWYRHDEDAEGRARTIIEGLMAQMTASGLFAPTAEFSV